MQGSRCCLACFIRCLATVLYISPLTAHSSASTTGERLATLSFVARASGYFVPCEDFRVQKVLEEWAQKQGRNQVTSQPVSPELSCHLLLEDVSVGGGGGAASATFILTRQTREMQLSQFGFSLLFKSILALV